MLNELLKQVCNKVSAENKDCYLVEVSRDFNASHSVITKYRKDDLGRILKKAEVQEGAGMGVFSELVKNKLQADKINSLTISVDVFNRNMTYIISYTKGGKNLTTQTNKL